MFHEADAARDQVQRCFHHEALFYAGEDGFLRGTLRFINEGLAADEPILVAVLAPKIEALREMLGADAELVHFADMQELGSNPARIIPAWRQFLEQHAPEGRPLRGIGEPIWPGRSQSELIECEHHESLLNLAFGDGQAWRLLCPYDLDGLEEQTITGAQRNHPFIAWEGATRPSDAYLYAHQAPNPFDGVLPAPSTRPAELVFGDGELGSVRQFMSDWPEPLLVLERREALVLAVNELATNSVRYGGGAGTLRIWREPEALVCEVSDQGHIEHPLSGRIRPRPEQPSGRGLWIVNQLCDLMQIRSGPSGSVVRLHMRLG
jgi:anti-sigma regulatory factor (Ser/Thr protein kinase)